MSDMLTGKGMPIVAGLVLAASPVLAATYTVTSISELQSRINGAAAGDVIIVQNGTYTTSGSIPINKVGTSGSPITIKAQSVGGVTIGGSNGFALSSPAAYITVEGFRFTHASAINIPSGTHHVRFMRNLIQLSIPSGSDVSFFNISGDDVELGYNELRNKSTLGEMLDVTGSGSQVARRLWVHHNYFHDFTSPGGNGAETIRLGLSGLSMSTGAAIVEYNLFVRCNGENELISNKSSGNTYRYNTFLDSPGAQLTLRHGNDCKAYGNYFRNTDGLRIYGDRHQVFSNYFEGNTKGIDMGNGDGEVATGSALTCHDRPDDVVVSFNTFVNNTNHYQMGGRTGGLGALRPIIANNIMQGAGNAASVSSTAPHTATWSGNILWNVTTAGNMPSSGYTTVNPMMAPDSRGVYHLQSGSPAIDSATGTYSAVTVDMDGQPRSGAKDKGADEVSGAADVAEILTASDVGPNAGSTPPPPTPTPTPTSPVPTATPTPTPTPTPTTPPSGGYVEITPGAAGVTASTNDGNVPGNAVDNDLSTRWSANGDGQWLRFDLGTTRTLARVKIAFYNGNVRSSSFDLQTSSDGSSWSNVLTGADSSGTTSNEETFDVAATPARYVRYLGHGNSVNLWNSLSEVSLFEPAEAATPTPTPSPTATPVVSTPTPTPPPASYVEVTPSGSAVTASTSDGNVPGNTVDNDLATRWSANGDGQWLQLDLGTARTIGHVKVAVYNGNARSNIFELQVSSGGGVWTTVWSGQSSGTTTAEETYDFTDVSAQWVRYLGHMNTANGFNSVTEVSVFATP